MVYVRKFGIIQMVEAGFVVMDVKFGFMLNAIKYVLTFRIWKTLLITVQSASQSLILNCQIQRRSRSNHKLDAETISGKIQGQRK